MTGAEGIPYTAWQQAVFVVLFICAIVILLNWQSKQQAKWQEFIQQRDQQWQEWMLKTNSQTADAMEHVTEALEKLSKKIDDHDGKVESRINTAIIEVKGNRKRV
jgi:hypothetical protein